MNKHTTIMWLIIVAVFLYAVGTLPTGAHVAPLPTEQQPVSHVNKDGTAVLYCYPDDPVREGEEIAQDPRKVPAPEDAVPDNLFDALKDPRTWA